MRLQLLLIVVLTQALGSGAGAEPLDEVQATLEAIDAALAKAKGQRVPAEPNITTLLCELGSGPGAENRDFLCENSTFVGHWLVKEPFRPGRKEVSSNLEVRRFSSPEQARAAKVTALERYGGGTVSVSKGAISWCNLDVFWSEDLLFFLGYECGGLSRVVKSVRAELIKASKPFETTDVIGVEGREGGWSRLFDSKGGRRAPLPDTDRFRHFVKVVNVPASDSVLLRKAPDSRRDRPYTVPATATCLPLVFTPPARLNESDETRARSVVVKFDGIEGWVARDFLADQPASECLPKTDR